MQNNEYTEYFQASADTFRFLGQALFKELNEEAIEALATQEWPKDSDNDHLRLGYAYLRRYFKWCYADRRAQLAQDYARIFLGAGIYGAKRMAAVPYESVFTSEEHLVMGASRQDALDVFARDGFKVDPSLHEPEDHIAFELEYLHHMNVRAAQLAQDGDTGALRLNVRRQAAFINKHLLNWLPILLKKSEEFAKTSFYLGILNVAIGSLEQSREVLKEIWEQTDPAKRQAA